MILLFLPENCRQGGCRLSIVVDSNWGRNQFRARRPNLLKLRQLEEEKKSVGNEKGKENCYAGEILLDMSFFKLSTSKDSKSFEQFVFLRVFEGGTACFLRDEKVNVNKTDGQKRRKRKSWQ